MEWKEFSLGKLRYVIHYPDGFDPATPHPVLFHFNGAGSRGDDISFCIDACDDGAPIEGVIMPATILKVPMQGNYSTEYYVDICDTDTLTSLLNSMTYGDTDADLIAKGDQMLLAPLPDGAEPMLQQYRIWYETEARDWISINDKSYCEQKAGESQMQSGILYRSEDCPFIYS